MVQLNGFTVAIITDGDQDKLKRSDGDYVALDNNTEYKLKLGNYRSTDAMAEVYIEGDNIGTFFIPANDSMIIERPADTNRKFTFMKETDYRASRAGVVPGASTNGLVKVVFFPKKQMPIVMVAPSSGRYENTRGPASPRLLHASMASFLRPSSPPRYQSGATVLGDTSYQRFGTRLRFSEDEIDWSNKTTITIRLVVRISEPYVSIGNRSGYKNGYPPRIDW